LKKIMVLEDEDSVREFIVLNLKRSGYTIIETANGDDAIKTFSSEKDIDLVILDVMVPGVDGVTVCKEIRTKNSSCGIIMLTAKAQEVDKVTAFMSGADDYLTKPFLISELIVRVDALFRRINTHQSPGQSSDEIISSPFRLDLKSRTLYKNNNPLDLTQVEFLIMKHFLENANIALSREDILNAVWGRGYYGEIKIVDVNIRRLRMKIEDDPSEPEYISTVWGFGYKWIRKN